MTPTMSLLASLDAPMLLLMFLDGRRFNDNAALLPQPQLFGYEVEIPLLISMCSLFMLAPSHRRSNGGGIDVHGTILGRKQVTDRMDGGRNPKTNGCL